MKIDSNHLQRLQSRITHREATIGIFGMSIDALKTAVGLAKTGFRIRCLDFLESRINLINRGISFSREISDLELSDLVYSGKISATSDFSTIGNLDLLMVYPLNDSKGHLAGSGLIGILRTVADYMNPGLMIFSGNESLLRSHSSRMKKILSSNGRRYGVDYLIGSVREFSHNRHPSHNSPISHPLP